MPYPNVRKSLESLDDKRLKNQRNEALVQLKTLMGEYKKGWPNHPSTKAYKHSQMFLAYYGAMAAVICYERGCRTKHADPIPFIERMAKLAEAGHVFRHPKWWGNPAIHKSHKSNLVRKSNYYKTLWPEVSPDHAYVWEMDSV